MARDLERFLAGEPWSGSPPSPSYRMRKIATRHRWALGGSGLFVALSITAVIWMSVALRQQMRANSNAAALRDVEHASSGRQKTSKPRCLGLFTWFRPLHTSSREGVVQAAETASRDN